MRNFTDLKINKHIHLMITVEQIFSPYSYKTHGAKKIKIPTILWQRAVLNNQVTSTLSACK